MHAVTCMRDLAKLCMLAAKVVATQTWLITTIAQDSRPIQRTCVYLVDIVKVLLGDSDPELIELGHVGVVDHPISQDTLTLMHPQAHHLDRLPVVVLGHAQQPLYHNTHDKICKCACTSVQYKWC